ncbi:Rhs-family protein, partial [hydrothermal vent metagenome]
YGNNSTTVTDPLGKSRTYNYQYINQQNRLTSVDESCGSCGGGGGNSEQIWNADGSLYQEIDFNGNITQHSYNDRGLETELIQAKDTTTERTTQTTWHPLYDTPVEIKEPSASSGLMVTTFTHYPGGEVQSKTITADGESRVWAYTYNSNGQLLSEDGPRIDVSDVTTWTYDAQGNKRTETNALGHLIKWDNYNAHGQAQSMTDANDVITTYVYDDLTRLTSSTTDGEVTSYQYTDSGQLEKLILPDASFLLYGYDPADRLKSITDNLGNQIKYTLDAAGNRKIEETSDNNAVLVQKITNVYNQLGRLEQSIGSDNQVTAWTYDSQGNEKTHTDPLLHLTGSHYDELNRLKQITDPDLNTIGYSYDKQDNLRTVTDPRGLITTYGYNGFNEQTKLASPDTGITDYNYDTAGNLISKTDARGEAATYVYDALNRVDSITYTDEVIDFTYDQGVNSKGRLSTVTDSSGQTSYSYDDEGRVDTKTQATGGTNLVNDYNYNALGQMDQLTTPSGAQVTYSYRADGRVVSISVNGVEISRSTEYFPFGEPKSWEYASSFTYQRNYDSDGRVDDYTQGADTQDLAYDAASRITTLADASNSWGFTYDNLDRLETANKTGTSLSWDYDETGNRLFEIENGSQTDYTTNPSSNQLDQLNSQIRAYDNAGNLIDDGIISSTYSGRNRLTSTQQGAQTTLYQYNAFGERVSKQSGSLTLFAYDEEGHLLGEYDQAGNLISEVIWLDDTPIAVIRPNTEPHDGFTAGDIEIFFIHPDHLDTPRTVVDAGNQVIWQWHSDPFGTALADENPDGDANNFEFNLRFPGQYFDTQTNTHYNYFRDYEPRTGRYVQSDPIGVTFEDLNVEIELKNNIKSSIESITYNNLYSYVVNNTLTNFDTFGLKTKKKKNKKSCNSCTSGRKGGADGSSNRAGHSTTKKGSKKRTNDKHTKCRPGTKTKQRKKGWYQR